jgi:UDP-GlcNAc:undecaprenyl-phosphate GlcNAc-1-phosphate transferase
MGNDMLIFASALALAIGVTPLVRSMALRAGIVDRPAARKVHLTPKPLLGGVAMYLAFVVALLVFSDRFNLPQLFGILVGATLVALSGYWDDWRGLRPLFKLVVQVSAALILYLSGVQVLLFRAEPVNLFLTLVWVVGITNSFNLLDNMDGLSGGVAAVAAAFFLLLAAMNKQILVASLSAAVLGACLGFLRYNFNPFSPASVFMGDVGAQFLGFVLAALGIKLRFFGNTNMVTWMIPVVMLGLPVFDTSLVVVSRLRRGLNPLTTPGKDHLSHRLVAMGMTQREAVLVLYLVSGALGMVAVYLTQASLLEAYLLGVVLLLVYVVALARLVMLDRKLGITTPREVAGEPTAKGG